MYYAYTLTLSAADDPEGPSVALRLTTRPVPVRFLDGQVFEAAAVHHDMLQESADRSGNPVQITLDRQHSPAVASFSTAIDVLKVHVKIYAFEFPGGEAVAPEGLTFTPPCVFAGEAVSYEVAPLSISLNVLHTLASLNRTIRIHSYSNHCQHFIYSKECGASKTGRATTTLAPTATGFTLVSPDFAPLAVDYLKGGVATATYVVPVLGLTVRPSVPIVSNSGAVVTLLRRFPFSLSGVSVTVLRGCQKTPSTCIASPERFGGYQYVPVKNPALSFYA